MTQVIVRGPGPSGRHTLSGRRIDTDFLVVVVGRPGRSAASGCEEVAEVADGEVVGGPMGGPAWMPGELTMVTSCRTSGGSSRRRAVARISSSTCDAWAGPASGGRGAPAPTASQGVAEAAVGDCDVELAGGDFLKHKVTRSREFKSGTSVSVEGA